MNAFHDQITAPLDCVGWVLHQLKGKANTKNPIAQFTHADALWCSTFAVMAWFAFVLGNKCTTTNTCLINATKTRRGSPQKPTICKINGSFGELIEAKDYAINWTTGRIMDREEMQRVEDDTDVQGTLVKNVDDRFCV